MKTLFLTLSLCLATLAAEANSNTNHSAKTLIQKIQRKLEQRKTLAQGQLVKFFVSPGDAPKQGDSVTVFAQNVTGFTDSETILEATFDGAAISLEHPAKELWVYDAGSFTEQRSHSFVAKVYIQDKAIAKELRDAIATLQNEIDDLNQQIEDAIDPELIAELTAQRDQKVALQNELIDALNNLKSPVGEEEFVFTIAAQDTGSDFPRITGISPNFGKFSSTNLVSTITGANFDATATLDVKFADQSSGFKQVDSATQISAAIPAFSTPGMKDLEIRFNKDGLVKNAVLKNAYFATSVDAMPNVAPVAVAGASQSVAFGTSASFSGSSSYDPNPEDTIRYEWRVISKPVGSTVALPGLGTSASYSIVGDVPGFYVLELRVFEDKLMGLGSSPSLTVLEVQSPANRTPSASAPSITAGTNTTRTSQISVTDLDTWQKHGFFIKKQSSLGTASVSSTGLVSFTSNTALGSDPIEVFVTDNGDPVAGTTVSIPVSVLNNQPPVINDPLFYTIRSQGVPIQVALSTSGPAGVISDPDNNLATLVWNFGDGTSERTFDLAVASISHNYMAPGTYTATLTATDTLGASTSQSVSVVVVDTDIPTAKFTASTLSGPAPLTVNFDASAASDSDGITSYRWLWGDGSPEEIGAGFVTRSHTFNNPGTYSVRFRARDPLRGNGEARVNIVVGGSSNSQPQAQYVIGPPRQVTVGTPANFDGNRSFTPFIGAVIANYNWNFGNFSSCPPSGANPGCIGSGVTTSYTYPSTPGNYFPALQVQTGGGANSPQSFQELFVVNQGYAPRAIARLSATSCVAPCTLNMNGSESYDYDGTLSSSSFNWSFGNGSFVNGAASTSYTFTSAGVYNVTLSVNDADGNVTRTTTTVSVTASRAKKRDVAYDPEREEQRQLLANACGAGQGSACYYLGQMYAEDGDEFTKTKLWEKACELGYQDACTAR